MIIVKLRFSPLILKQFSIHHHCRPKAHKIHHRPPFDRYYCIFNGWMNPVLAQLNFWRTAENLITKYTGNIPRADDAGWTGRFEVSAAAPQ